MKRAFSYILVVFMAFSLLSVSAMAAESGGIEEFREGRTKSVYVTQSRTFFLQEDGTLWGCGAVRFGNLTGGLGNHGAYDATEATLDSTLYIRTYPEKLLSGVDSVLYFEEFPYWKGIVIVLMEDGSIWGTGELESIFGETYLSGIRNTNEFVKLWDDVLQIGMSWGHVLMVKEDGSLWGFGDNLKGQLGQGAPQTWEEYVALDESECSVASPIKIMDGVKKAAAKYSASMALKTDGTLWAWGGNIYGQLGTGKPKDEDAMGEPIGAAYPQQILEDVVDFRLVSDYSAALREDGSLWVWGSPYGTWEDICNLSPVKLDDGVKGFLSHSSDRPLVYQKQDGTVWKYGFDSVCTSTEEEVMDGKPVEIPLTDVSGLYIDPTCYFQIKSDGSLWAFGWNINNKFGIGQPDKYLDAGKLFSDLEDIDKPVQLTGYTPAAAQPAPNPFTDTAVGAYYYDAVQWAVDRKITAGTSATTFSPDATCTNGQILTFLWRAKGQPEPTVSNPFADVSESAYYYKAALWAYENGMVSGTSLDADAPCTRSQTVAYLWKLAGRPAPVKSAAFADVEAGAAYAQAVSWAVEQSITSGTSAAAFTPDGVCTRGQIVTFLYRDMGK